MNIKHIWRMTLTTIMVSALLACARDEANRYYSAQKYEPRDQASVTILWAPPARKYTVLADFQSRGETPQDMQKKGAAIGADAVIVSLLGGDYSLSEKWASDDRYSTTYTRIAATAIKFD